MVSFHVVVSALADCAALLTPGAGLAPQPATSRRTHGLDLAGTIARPAVAANTSTVPSHAYAPGRTMQAIVAGYVPAEVVAVLCAADPAHADARAFLFAAAALDEAAVVS